MANKQPDWLNLVPQNREQVAGLLRKHQAEPHIRAVDYSRDKRLALGLEVLRKKRIYLDTKYWIFCRDAKFGRPQKPIHHEIWQAIRTLVQSGMAICPVNHPLFVEVRRQGNPQRQQQTAEIVDELSGGVALQPPKVLIEIEILHLLTRLMQVGDGVYPLNQMVWTYAGYLLGESTPVCKMLDAATNQVLQKCMFDTLAGLPFSAIVAAMQEAGVPPGLSDAAFQERQAEMAEQHRHEFKSFDEVFMIEVAGMLDLIKPVIRETLLYIYARYTGGKITPADDGAVQESVRQFSNLIYHAYMLGKLSVELPILQISAGIHAAVRHQNRRYAKGDLYDGLHTEMPCHTAISF